MVDIVADAAARELRRRLDEKDFVFELTGRSAGRMRRFFSHSAGSLPGMNEETEEDRDFFEGFLRTVSEQIRQSRIEHLRQQLALAETISYEALMLSRERMDMFTKLIRSMLDNAQQLPDGRRVFLSRDGSYAIDEFGERLTEQQMTQIEWRTEGARAEDYLEARQGLEQAGQDVEDLQEYRTRLGASQERLASEEALSPAELSGLEDLLGEMPGSTLARKEGSDAQAVRGGTGSDYLSSRSDPSNAVSNP